MVAALKDGLPLRPLPRAVGAGFLLDFSLGVGPLGYIRGAFGG